MEPRTARRLIRAVEVFNHEVSCIVADDYDDAEPELGELGQALDALVERLTGLAAAAGAERD